MADVPVPRLAALATATPPHVLTQEDVARRAAAVFGMVEGGFERLLPVYRNAMIERRRACAPIDWYTRPHSFHERNELFLSAAGALLAQAARDALARAGLAASDIDSVVTVCSTGVATPALDARLMALLPLRPDVRRTPLFGLGCAGGVLGLARAAELARAAPDERVLLLVVELCTLTFRSGDRSKSNIVASALFGDGAAAAIVTCRPDAPAASPRIGRAGEHTWPGSLDVMGWDVADDGLKVVFSRDIPTLVREDLRAALDPFLARAGIGLGEIDEFVCHPGGAKVLDALEDCFALRRGALAHARATLREYGNMSAATVLFVLRASLDAGGGGRRLLTTLGPGFTAGFLLLEPA